MPQPLRRAGYLLQIMVAQILVSAVDAPERLSQRVRLAGLSAAIDGCRIEEARLRNLPRAIIAQAPKIAGAIALVAGRLAALMHAQQQTVALAVYVQRYHLLHIAGGLALLPEFLARPAPEVGQPCLQRALQGRVVHKR